MKWKFTFVSLVFIMALSSNVGAESLATLWPEVDMLQSKEFVDLTHAFHPGTPHWPGFDNEVKVTLYHCDEGIGTKGDGFLAPKHEIRGSGGLMWTRPLISLVEKDF